MSDLATKTQARMAHLFELDGGSHSGSAYADRGQIVGQSETMLKEQHLPITLLSRGRTARTQQHQQTATAARFLVRFESS